MSDDIIKRMRERVDFGRDGGITWFRLDNIAALLARLDEAREAARTWENEAERRSRRYEECAVKLDAAEREREQFQKWKHDHLELEKTQRLQIDCAHDEVMRLREDSKRIGWLDDKAHCASWNFDEAVKMVIRADDGAEFTGPTWRAAIDAARAAEQSDERRE